MAAKKGFSQKRLIFALAAWVFITTAEALLMNACAFSRRAGAGEIGVIPVSRKCDVISAHEAFRNMKDILHPSSKTEDGSIYCFSRNVSCPFSTVEKKISKENLIAIRKTQAIAHKKYEKEFLISITEGGKNAKNVPSIVREWRDAVEPFFRETI
jgi:hypothetical protein